MTNPFAPATKEQAWLRLALIGISGSGKTYSALNIAQHLIPGGKVAVIDTEHGSASKYADLFTFDVVELSDYRPAAYIAMIKAAAANGYEVVIIDSLSHAWDALLEMKDKVSKKGGNSYTAWADITPLHKQLIEAIVSAPIHVIGTMRAKSDYVLEEYTNPNGKKSIKPVKVGLAAIQRDGFEYEFDVAAQMDIENNMIVQKTRCPRLNGEVFHRPGEEVARILAGWLGDGVAPEPAPVIEQLHHTDKSIVHDASSDEELEQRRQWLYADDADERLLTLASKARDFWPTKDDKPMTWPHVYNRFACIIRLSDDEPSPKNRDGYLDMMRRFCPFDAGALWKEVQLYESEEG